LPAFEWGHSGATSQSTSLASPDGPLVGNFHSRYSALRTQATQSPASILEQSIICPSSSQLGPIRKKFCG